MLTRNFAILIDAGFLKRKIGSAENPITPEQIIQFTEKLSHRPELKGHHLHRIYYYDAEPMRGKWSKPLTGGQKINFSTTTTYTSNMALLDALKKKSYFAIRLGELNFRGWQVNPIQAK